MSMNPVVHANDSDFQVSYDGLYVRTSKSVRATLLYLLSIYIILQRKATSSIRSQWP